MWKGFWVLLVEVPDYDTQLVEAGFICASDLSKMSSSPGLPGVALWLATQHCRSTWLCINLLISRNRQPQVRLYERLKTLVQTVSMSFQIIVIAHPIWYVSITFSRMRFRIVSHASTYSSTRSHTRHLVQLSLNLIQSSSKLRVTLLTPPTNKNSITSELLPEQALANTKSTSDSSFIDGNARFRLSTLGSAEDLPIDPVQRLGETVKRFLEVLPGCVKAILRGEALEGTVWKEEVRVVLGDVSVDYSYGSSICHHEEINSNCWFEIWK